MRTIAKISLLFVFAALLTTFATADTPGAHPAYLHALTDLRHARAHIDKWVPNGRVDSDEGRAVRAIDAAINDIKEASIDDGKNLNDHPPVDEHFDRAGRYRRAMELLDGAYRDIDQREDNGWARGVKHRALGHIDEARRAIRHAMEDRHGW
jgi:tetratricopeptide (TPR) repeat protein